MVQSCLRALPKQPPLPQSALSDGVSSGLGVIGEDTPGLGGDPAAAPAPGSQAPATSNVTLAHLPGMDIHGACSLSLQAPQRPRPSPPPWTTAAASGLPPSSPAGGGDAVRLHGDRRPSNERTNNHCH